MPEEKNRSKLYERIRKNFVRISSELGLYEFNGKTRPKIVKSNYLNYSDEWARNRFEVLGYDKRKIILIFNEV